MKILIVDDQYINRYLLEILLTGYGSEVVSAEDGMRALELIRDNGIDLIISDILLPKMDGLGVLRRLRETMPDSMPTVILLSHFINDHTASEAARLGGPRHEPGPGALARAPGATLRGPAPDARTDDGGVAQPAGQVTERLIWACRICPPVPMTLVGGIVGFSVGVP